MTKLIKTLLCLVFFLCLPFVNTLFAEDTDLYMASGEGIEPNILIMFDNSGSMNEEVQAYFYDSTITYNPSPLVVPLDKRDSVYRSGGGGWILWKNNISEVPCASARTALTNHGHYEGYTNSSCTGQSRTLRTGNYRNYLASIGGDETLPKLTIAKRVITDFLNTISGVRIGVMNFNYSEGGFIKSTIKSLTDANRTQLITDVNNITANTWTPLAETLYESGLYFKGGSSYFNSGVVYTSPIQYYCQRNYVIIITDGESTKDRNSILATAIGDRDGDGREPGGAHEVYYASDGSDYLDDVAKYLYDTDLRSDLTGQQNIVTYTIGFTINSSLLERTATHGHGRYFYSNNAQDLANVFQNIIEEVLSKSCSFVAPIVPVSRMERTTAGDKIYLAFFKPLANKMWSGNIKKYGVVQQDAGALEIGDIVDVNGSAALDDSGQFLLTSRSYWTSVNMDGGEVEEGGVGEVLLNRSSARNLYTYMETNANLTHSSNAFVLSNASITPTLLGLLSGDTTGRDKLINFVHGYDAYDDDGNGITSEKRDWILGAFLHSRPLIIHYATRSVIFAGSNSGMLHAVDDSDGSELWGFIPPNLFNKLQALHSDIIESFVDSSPKAYISYNTDGSINRVILIFGERRGGNHYYALDVTNPLSPQYLWKISPDMTDYSELGQTWSSPNIAKIAYGDGEKWVAFLGGGYDENQDNNPVTNPDSKGRAIYVVDVLTGSLVRRFSILDPGFSAMTYSIPSDIARVDTDGNGKIDRLYVGDMGGQIWRFDVMNSDPASWTGKIIFNANRKIFYPPDVTLEKDTVNYEMLFFGTGDRENPKESATINRLYAVKDKNSATVLTESNLVDVTLDLLQNSSTSEEDKTALLGQLMSGNGWYIRLDTDTGEKCLSTATVFNKTAYYTTFIPTFGTEGDPCFVGEGRAKVYALKYDTGNAAFNLDLTNDDGSTALVSRSDRSKIIGSAIPSAVIITFIRGKPVAYIGVGGGVFQPLVTGSQLASIYWRIVF